MGLQNATAAGNFAHRSYLALELNGKLEGAGPHRLVALCYDELEQSLAVVVSLSRAGKLGPDHAGLHRARSILIALESNLDFRGGGDVAVALATTYRAMRRELTEAARQGSVSRLEMLLEGAQSMSAAWAAIAPAPRQA